MLKISQLITVVGIVLACSGIVGGQAPKNPAFSFTNPASLDLEWDTFTGPVEVGVTNLTSIKQTLVATLHSDSAEPFPLKIENPTVSLEPGKQHKFKLSRVGSELTSSVALKLLVVNTVNPLTVAERPITVAVATGSVASVDAWSIQVRTFDLIPGIIRLDPLGAVVCFLTGYAVHDGRCYQHTTMPVTRVTNKFTYCKNIAVLNRESGGSIKIRLRAEGNKSCPVVPEKKIETATSTDFNFEIHSDDLAQLQPGDYKGSILGIVGPGKDAKPVSLTVQVRPHVLLPLLAIALGVWLGFFVQRAIGVKRPTEELRERVLAVLAAFSKSLNSKSMKQSPSPPSIHKDITEKGNLLLDKIERLSQMTFTTLDLKGEAYTGLVQEIVALEAVNPTWLEFVAQWAQMKSPSIAGVETALTAMRDAIFPAVVGAVQRPAAINGKSLWGETVDKISKSGEITIDTLLELKKDATAVISKAANWHQLANYATVLHTEQVKLDQDSNLNAAEKLQVASLLPIFQKVAIGLFTSPPSAVTEPDSQIGILDGVYSQVVAIQKRLSVAASTERKISPLSKPGLIPGGAKALAPVAPVNPVSVQTLLGGSRGRLRLYNWLLLLVSFALAVIAGLNDRYYAGNFGSAWDFLGAIVWGIGAKIGVEAIATALQALPLLRLRPD
jgi:hypothetical protein